MSSSSGNQGQQSQKGAAQSAKQSEGAKFGTKINIPG